MKAASCRPGPPGRRRWRRCAAWLAFPDLLPTASHADGADRRPDHPRAATNVNRRERQIDRCGRIERPPRDPDTEQLRRAVEGDLLETGLHEPPPHERAQVDAVPEPCRGSEIAVPPGVSIAGTAKIVRRMSVVGHVAEDPAQQQHVHRKHVLERRRRRRRRRCAPRHPVAPVRGSPGPLGQLGIELDEHGLHTERPAAPPARAGRRVPRRRTG